MKIKRRNKSDQFWSVFHAKKGWDKTSINSLHDKSIYIWCANDDAGKKYLLSVKEWDELELEHRCATIDGKRAEVIINRTSGDTLLTTGDEETAKLLIKGLPVHQRVIGGCYAELDYID